MGTQYALEQLFLDQDRDFVTDAIAGVLAWVPGKARARRTQPYRFEIQPASAPATTTQTLELTWNEEELKRHDPGVLDRAQRLRTGRTVPRELVAELAAYGLAFAAISAFMPGRRVIGFMRGVAPDFLFDDAAGAIRGVEVAGRTAGGRRALLVVRNEKVGALQARADIVEVHLSLWCASPRLSIMEQVKP